MIEWPMILLGLWKTIVLVYDVVTLPVYCLLQRPWEPMKKAHRVRAVLEKPEDPYSPWIRSGQPGREIAAEVIGDNESLGQLFSKCFQVYGQRRCYGFRQILSEEEEKQPNGKVFRKLVLDDSYTWLTFYDANQRIDDISQGFLASGIKHGDRVMLFAETRLEWMLSAQALMRCGATMATLYATLGDEAIAHGINETEATHIITSVDLLKKLQKLSPKLPKVTTVIHMEDPLKKPLKLDENANPNSFKVVSLASIETQGHEMNRSGKRLNTVPSKGDDLAVLMYTSGSTGVPKAVMISHRNIMAAMRSGIDTILSELDMEYDIFLGFLPLAHVMELVAELSMHVTGVPIAYSTVQTMTDSSTGVKRGCKGDMSVVKPTMMPCVPLILDRIRKSVLEKVQRNNRIARGIFEFSLDYKTFWTRKGFRTPLVDKFVFSPVQKITGGRLSKILVGGAPLSPETQEFASNCLDCTVLIGYASTECVASAALMDFDDHSFGRTGGPLFGVKLRLTDWREGGYFATDKPHPRGEIVIGGPHIADGYFKQEELTKESFFVENGTKWWYTGDIGEMYPDGTLKIIDRKKDLVKLQHGEYISLGKVEAALSFCDYVDNICVHGDSMHNNVIALIVPNRAALRSLADNLDKSSLEFSQLCQDRQVIDAVKKSLTDHGLKSGLMRVEIPSDIKLCPEDWIPDTGLVTAALKIRRKQITEFYKSDILSLYGAKQAAESSKSS